MTDLPPIGHNNPPKPKRKRQKRGDNHYVNNKEFTLALDEYAREYKACVAEDKEKPQMSRYLGECVIKMANRLASTPRFYGYSYRDEMIQNAILGAVKYMHRFDGDRFNNGFAYVTQILFSHMIQTIKKEKKDYEKNLKLIQDAEIAMFGHESEGYTDIVNDHAKNIADQKLADIQGSKAEKGKGGFQLRSGYTKEARAAYTGGTPLDRGDK